LRQILRLCIPVLVILAALSAPSTGHEALQPVQHVLLISVDGLHALDVARFVEKFPHSALAELSAHGVTYTNARTPANSDSFPGLLALVTGGSPQTHGMFYDSSFDRTIFDPKNTSCFGLPGNMMIFDESIDLYIGNVSQDVIDPTKLPRHLDRNGNCVALFPHSALKTNTIFEVVKAQGGRTAWADKHPAYDLVNGPSGTGVDDLYTPEITSVNGFDATVSVVCTVENDQKKVNAIINEIHGLTHDGKPAPGVPTVLGMNFQAVSVGQKVASDSAPPRCHGDFFQGKPGGYLDGSGTPTEVLTYGLLQTDLALGSMIRALKEQNLYDSTLFVVTAKHGQSPINPAKVNKPGHFASVVAGLPGASTDPGAIAIVNAGNCSTGPCGFVQDDDVALVWLGNQADTQAAADFLNKNAVAASIDDIMAEDEIKLRFNDPLTDPRTPDLIAQPVYGTTYTSSTSKNAEHGGFSFGDTNVGLIVSQPGLSPSRIKSPVATSQVAATILQALGIAPTSLKSVRLEQTKVLPGLPFGGN
jgi:hypothetical protein